MKEIFKITVYEKDDLLFVSIINRLITTPSNNKTFETVTITKVNNWFDHKWLNYSGKEAVQFEPGGLVNNDLALSVKWKDQITFPPFNPNRILSNRTYPLNREVMQKTSNQFINTKSAGKTFKIELNCKLRISFMLGFYQIP